MSMATTIFPSDHVYPLRSKLGLTQVEFADKLGVSQSLVARWEAGERLPQGPAAVLLRQLQEKTKKNF